MEGGTEGGIKGTEGGMGGGREGWTDAVVGFTGKKSLLGGHWENNLFVRGGGNH